MINKNCICCKQPLIWDNGFGGSFSKCHECDISQWNGYAFRTVGATYRIEWELENTGFKTIVSRVRMENGLAIDIHCITELYGAKLFDAKTVEQLEKLLLLL
jgi:hypothetical protein